MPILDVIAPILRRGLSRVLSDVAWTSAALGRALVAPDAAISAEEPAAPPEEAPHVEAPPRAAAVLEDVHEAHKAQEAQEAAPPAISRAARRWALQQLSTVDLERRSNDLVPPHGTKPGATRLSVHASPSPGYAMGFASFQPVLRPNRFEPERDFDDQMRDLREELIEHILIAECGPVVQPLRNRPATLLQPTGKAMPPFFDGRRHGTPHEYDPRQRHLAKGR
jgi:hypothetical protein